MKSPFQNLKLRQLRFGRLAPRSVLMMATAVGFFATTGCQQKQEESAGLVCPASFSAKPQSTEPITMPILAISPVAAAALFNSTPNMTLAGAGDVTTFATFTVTGNANYARFLPTTTGGAKIDYAGGTSLYPIRRAVVQIMSGSTPIASGSTDDNGGFSVSVSTSAGASLYARVQSRSVLTNYVKDGFGGATQENCQGGSWDIKVVNNATGSAASQNDPTQRPIYALDGSNFTAPAGGTVSAGTLNALIAVNGSNAYTNRAGAPFALLDTAMMGLETACEARAGINFPLLYVNWSTANTTTSGSKYNGDIGTSFYTAESGVANLYILGKEDVDTDELDNHVVAHEFGHYIENNVFRSDSIGGMHSLGDSLDPRLAFGEGFGNAFAGMVHHDPLYIDTSGAASQTGFSINVSSQPSANDDRGPWSERAMQYLLWALWEARDGTANSGDFAHIGNVLENYQKTTAAFTTGLSFASYYAQVYGLNSESLASTWSTAGLLNSSTNAFCTADCSAGPVFELWDTDNDLGRDYSGSGRRYKQTTGSTTLGAEFWRMYRPLSSGTNAATAHDQISLGGYSTSSYFYNKLGVHRYYYLTATSSMTTVSVTGPTNCSTADLLDMAVYYKGSRVGLDEASSGATSNCPSVTFCTTAGQTYVVDIYGFGTVSSYSVKVSP